jgi:hypothetical protein
MVEYKMARRNIKINFSTEVLSWSAKYSSLDALFTLFPAPFTRLKELIETRTRESGR